MSRGLPRRRVLRVLAAGLALPLGVLGARALRDVPEPARWQGEVLGAWSGMTLWHPNPGHARRAIARMLVEIERLENVFSLYRPDSELARLNRDGRLEAPSADLVEVFGQSQRIAELSGGAFDPTTQPLWQLYAAGRGGELERVLPLVDYAAVSAGRREVRFGRPGMAASLNGIAQGHITDRITRILGDEGFENAMIELGETRALGAAPDGRPFAVGLVNPQAPTVLDREVALAGAALAVSGGYGMRFAAGGHHIFDPRTGQSPESLTQVAVVSPRAVWADALSTAIYVAGEGAAEGLLSAYAGSRAILWRSDGTVREI